MIAHAKRRGPVLVAIDDRTVQAFLVAWRPHRRNGGRRNTARVAFLSGNECTFPVSAIRLPEVTA